MFNNLIPSRLIKFCGFFDADSALGGECQKSGFVFRKSGITV